MLIDNIPSFTKLNLAKLRAEKKKPIKPSMEQRASMVAHLVRLGFTVYESCRSVRLSTEDYYRIRR